MMIVIYSVGSVAGGAAQAALRPRLTASHARRRERAKAGYRRRRELRGGFFRAETPFDRVGVFSLVID